MTTPNEILDPEYLRDYASRMIDAQMDILCAIDGLWPEQATARIALQRCAYEFERAAAEFNGAARAMERGDNGYAEKLAESAYATMRRLT